MSEIAESREPITAPSVARFESEAQKKRSKIEATAALISRGGQAFDRLRHLAINTLVVVCVVGGGFAIYKVAAKTNFVVKDISVPSSLQERGVTGSVIAQQILDHVTEIDTVAGSRKQKAEISGLDFQSTMPTINLPVGGLNLGAIVSELRQLLGYTETIITGEVYAEEGTKNDKDSPFKYGLRLRISGQGPIFKSEHPDADVQRLITLAAEKIMYKFDPINLGYYYYRRKDYDKAEETADAALAGEAAENYPWAYTMRGLIARDQGKFTEAAENFRQVIELDPRFAMGYVNLSGILRLDGKLGEAETAARKAIDLMPTQQDGYAALAVVLMDRGDREQALAEMKKGVAAAPKDPQSHLALGRLQHQMEQYEAAIASFKASAQLAPAAAPYISAANSSLELKRQEEALAFLRRATEAEPKNFEVWLAYGAAALKRQEMTKAEKALEKAVALAPSATAPLLQLSSIYISQKRFAAADAIFSKHANSFGHDPEFLIGWSHLLLEEGKKSESEAKLAEVQAAARGNPVTLQNVARDFESRGEIPEAIAAYEKVIAADPKMTEVITPYIEKLTKRLAQPPPPPVADQTGRLLPAPSAASRQSIPRPGAAPAAAVPPARN